ncbi:unnamed protein product [Acanthocheilonema viteae]|uniref:Phosphomannomutase n=1 Tax=Acanthocheilonema viteae TaxID=6277 RepID=A0A498SF51_ACAVI|nr:unnamed protein product [Acanthocheilonema viteae]
MSESKGATILLFDVDGTLTLPRQKMDPAMSNFLMEVHKTVPLAIVSGSDLPKVVEQLGENLEDGKILTCTNRKILSRFNYVFCENGLVGVSKGTTFPVQGMLNLSPIGRCCTQEERLQFVAYDKEHGVRQKFVKRLQDFTEGWNLNVCIGGQISIDVFPCGWDKTYCLQFLNDFHTIHFFGDRTAPVRRRFVYNSTESVKDLLYVYS